MSEVPVSTGTWSMGMGTWSPTELGLCKQAEQAMEKSE